MKIRVFFISDLSRFEPKQCVIIMNLAKQQRENNDSGTTTAKARFYNRFGTFPINYPPFITIGYETYHLISCVFTLDNQAQAIKTAGRKNVTISDILGEESQVFLAADD